jgi:hypothetical protein
VTVGSYTKAQGKHFRTLVEAWNGTTWSVTPSPNRVGSNILYGVSCTSPTFCVAVGDVRAGGSGSVSSLIETWNGTAWSVTPSPNRSGDNYLSGVSCTSPTFCVAVGRHFKHNPYFGVLVETWDGTRWSVTANARVGPGFDDLGGVSCTSPSFCVAVGTGSPGASTLIESWNGTRWSLTPSPNLSGRNSLAEVTCTSATFCVAVGSAGKPYDGPALIETWDGTRWSLTPSANQGGGGNTLWGVSCTSSTDCVAAGATTYLPDPHSIPYNLTLVENWDGTNWSLASSPTPGSDVLSGVSCTTAKRCVASGSDGSADYFATRTLIETGSSPPTITGFSPSTGPPGTAVTITGTNLDGATKVTFNGTAATITQDTATNVKVTVPSGATTGRIRVVTDGGRVESATNFTVTW